MSGLPNIPKAVAHKDWRKNQVVDEAKDAKVLVKPRRANPPMRY